ncbi:MAG: DNA translocase FtsK 4TM domain-containing protein, partial [Fimbriimonadaceae bacterium]|nr:DNA translocase FtsK 4TM domain-containing protein [Fimbriimonadaceae bacterium]
MPKEGQTTATRRKPAAARIASATKKPVASARKTDAFGLVCLALALTLGVALGVGQAGLLGDGMADLFRALLGKAAWALPVALAAIGIRALAGKPNFAASHITIGAALILGTVTAFFAQSLNGDFFDPTVMSGSGGYVGAVFGWIFGTLLGVAAPVGLILMGLLGVLLVIDQPLREFLPKRSNPEPKPILNDKPERRKPFAAVVMPEREPITTSPEAVAAAPVKKKPIFREPEPAPTLQTESQAPREGYELPPISLLEAVNAKGKRDPKEVQRNIEILEATLEQFGVDAHVAEVASGPTVTRYELQVGPGVRVNRVTNLSDNIAMALAAPSVRIEAPIPGKNAIGIEVPMKQRQTVALREMCDSLEFHNVEDKLTVALGKDVSGAPVYVDLTRMPHVLIGGATNSGKSIGLATLIMSLILRRTPKEVRMVLIDPKQVELSFFDGLPHLMCPVVTDVKEAAGVLRAVVREMERRYNMFKEGQVRNIDGWNAKASYNDRLPYIVVVVDELADLMIQVANEVENSICRLGQLARATGIHLVIATQRPSVDVITGTIKANIPSRIAFAVSSYIDSRTILDSAGAEELIGRGDMLYRPIGAGKPARIQGCYVSEKEIEGVTRFWRQQEGPRYILKP